VRDFTDVRDVVRAYGMLLAKGEPGAVYNVCSGTGRSIRELLDGLLKLSTTAIEVVVSERRTRKDEADVILGSARALRDVCGWTPEIPWEATLSDILADWRRRVASEKPA
jgi:GDP-4-dehydro-6-deoxy-D-mannose reductase